ncbi:MAG: hypothetical protein QXX17_00965 [Conexivisphaerales archaeon]
MHGISMTIFAFATGVMVLLASLYGVWLLQTQASINSSSIQLAEDRAYAEGFLISMMYACISSIDNLLSGSGNFEVSANISNDMQGSCISGVKTMVFTSPVEIGLSNFSIVISASGADSELLRMHVLIYVHSYSSAFELTKDVSVVCPYSILQAQVAVAKLEQRFASGEEFPLNQTLLYPYWTITVTSYIRNTTVLYNLRLVGQQQLCATKPANTYQIFSSGELVINETNSVEQ